MLTYSLKNIQVRTNIVEEDKYLYLFSVEEVNKLVQNGTPFRDAYRIVGKNSMTCYIMYSMVGKISMTCYIRYIIL